MIGSSKDRRRRGFRTNDRSATKSEIEMANWFYIAGSLCFLIGTAVNMVGK